MTFVTHTCLICLWLHDWCNVYPCVYVLIYIFGEDWPDDQSVLPYPWLVMLHSDTIWVNRCIDNMSIFMYEFRVRVNVHVCECVLRECMWCICGVFDVCLPLCSGACVWCVFVVCVCWLCECVNVYGVWECVLWGCEQTAFNLYQKKWCLIHRHPLSPRLPSMHQQPRIRHPNWLHQRHWQLFWEWNDVVMGFQVNNCRATSSNNPFFDHHSNNKMEGKVERDREEGGRGRGGGDQMKNSWFTYSSERCCPIPPLCTFHWQLIN